MSVNHAINGALKEVQQSYTSMDGALKTIYSGYAGIDGAQKNIYNHYYRWIKYTWTLVPGQGWYDSYTYSDEYVYDEGSLPRSEEIPWVSFTYTTGTGYTVNSETGLITLTGIKKHTIDYDRAFPDRYWSVQYDYIIDGIATEGYEVFANGSFGYANGGIAYEDYEYWDYNKRIKSIWYYKWSPTIAEQITSVTPNKYPNNPNIGIHAYGSTSDTYFSYNPTYHFIG